MNYELDPALRDSAKAILGTSSAKRGVEYLRSPSKRKLDILVSGLACPVILPIILMTGAAILAADKHKPFVSLERVNPVTNERFRIWKLNTMVPHVEKLEAELLRRGLTLLELKRTKKDPRVTPMGRVLRKLSINETPQLINVFFGGLTLVGPRSFTSRQWESEIKPNAQLAPYKDFLELLGQGVKFGLTGFYGIFGRADLNMPDWLALEVMYLQEANLRADLKIIALTFPAVLSRKGAY